MPNVTYPGREYLPEALQKVKLTLSLPTACRCNDLSMKLYYAIPM